jgi:hypothetical protein
MRQRLSLFEGDTLALESIEFQRDQMLFKELSNLIRELEKIPERDIADHELGLQLAAVIKEHTGILVATTWAGAASDLACCPPMANPNNVFWNRLDLWIRDIIGTADADKVLSDPSKKAIGTVDLKRGKVGGVFSEMSCQLIFPAALAVSKKYTPEEKAAGVIHELGHLFGFFEYIAAVMTTNYILSAIAKTYDTPTPVKQREIILTKIKSETKMKELDTEALAQSSNKKIVEVVLISSYARELKSEIGSNVFDINGWELMADQFAARQGAARDVTTFLDKLYREFGSIKYRSTASWLFIEALKIAGIIFAPFTMGISFSIVAVMMMMDQVEQSDMLYGTLKTRFGRMRDQLVAEMKINQDKDRQQQLAQDIQVIDDVLNGFQERQQLLGYVYDFISPVQRARNRQEKLQRELEQLAHNDLFVRSAALKQLGA